MERLVGSSSAEVLEAFFPDDCAGCPQMSALCSSNQKALPPMMTVLVRSTNRLFQSSGAGEEIGLEAVCKRMQGGIP